MKRAKRVEELRNAFKHRILVTDGAMGTALQLLNLSSKEWGDEKYEGCNEFLNIHSPGLVEKIHSSHLQNNADIIFTNTFSGSSLVLAEFSLDSKAYEINFAAANIARKAADKFSKDKTRFVAGSLGPTTRAISLMGGVKFTELVETYFEQARALIDGGVDFLLFETCQDTCNVKAGLVAVDRLSEQLGYPVPIAVSGTIEPMGTMLAGQTAEAFVSSLAHRDLLYLGLNCATGPEFMTDSLRSMSKIAPFPLGCVPNAGLPDEDGQYLESPSMMGQVLKGFIASGWINLIGGCCGTTAEHTKAFSDLCKEKKPRLIPKSEDSFLSGLERLEINDNSIPYLVGERTNSIGSRKFKSFIAQEKFDEAAELGKSQVKLGAQLLDVCLANPDRDELSDMSSFLEVLTRKIKVPLVIDSTQPEVIRSALEYCQGKALVNSINFEEGDSKFKEIIPVLRQFGAAVVVGTIDEDPIQGMALTVERKLEIAKRAYDLVVVEHGMDPHDLYWDPLVFPCGTGDENYRQTAPETIEAITKLKESFPGTRTILGLSNISFGLPPQGRSVLNAVFLHHCIQAGLDLAILNAGSTTRFQSLTDLEVKICDDLLFDRSNEALSIFIKAFKEKKPQAMKSQIAYSPEEVLKNAVLEGSKEGLIEALDKKLQNTKPLEIVNGPLMEGMDEVGRLFSENKLIVAEVLQSAEVMKAAVAYLEPHMEKNEAGSRGKVLLATVKGDVHDIGKNLVEIILANNGFHVINLGIKVPPQDILHAISQHKPDMVGLSGLLVKSAHQMVVTLKDLSQAGIETPVLLGGAALSERFVDKKLSVAYSKGTVVYARDAMAGLELAKNIQDPKKFEEMKSALGDKRKKLIAQDTERKQAPSVSKAPTGRSKKVPILDSVPQPTDFDRHVLVDQVSPQLIWQYINPLMLYSRHLGIGGDIIRKLSQNPKLKISEISDIDSKTKEVWNTVEEVKSEFIDAFRSSGVFQFYQCYSENEFLYLVDGGGQLLETFKFQRQVREPFLSLPDFVDPDIKKKDNIALFCVSFGKDIRSIAEDLKKKGEYLKSHVIQALAIESAEAYAEYLHSQIRKIWGNADSADMTMLERFQAKYIGKRYSFGYSACPTLEDQAKLFRLLRPEEVGIKLTDGFMMEPEASVSALVFHHPSATYFSTGDQGLY